MQLATHHLHDQQGTHQGIKENTHQGTKENTHHHVVGQLELAFTKNEPPTQPVTSLRTSYLHDNKSILLSENETNNLPDKVQETTISAQISPAEDMSPPSNMIATTTNEVMRVSVPLQATQQKPEMHKMPELVETPHF